MRRTKNNYKECYGMSIVRQMERYTYEDITNIIDTYQEKYGQTISRKSVSMRPEVDSLDSTDNIILHITAVFRVNPSLVTTSWDYICENSEDIYMSDDIDAIVEDIHNQLNSSMVVNSSTTIMAADDTDDLEDDSAVESLVGDEPSVTDAIDDMADNIEDLQDQIDDVQEDDVDIAVDNNIGNHYIAECDRCHAVFISAIVESDQSIDKISGVCPICEKESDQYLKWVIKPIEN